MAKEAVNAGAEYLISPNVDEEVIAYGVSQGIEVWPGALTPTEIVKAYNLGASAVKLFPYASLGPKYLREIKAPLDAIPIIATGGIGVHNMREAFDSGAMAVGVGSSLVNKHLIQNKKFDELTQQTKTLINALK
jgi:2-dehydro-3-deoxyphosphogluconate aldolase/(4S)-4-hydroxy-2-oxoglutarate aldolase